MENLEVKQFKNIYKNKKVLITGHNGFKGSWLLFWLNELGAYTYGVSDLRKHQNSFHSSKISDHSNSFYFNICNYSKTEKLIKNIKPDIIFHLAAQPYVLSSFENPYYTFYNNFLSTLNILDIYKNIKFKSKLLVVTSDKVYENNNKNRPFKEIDRLGGIDPYSSSKSICENMFNSYNKTFLSIKRNKGVASVRAGNVIGGGDWGNNRIIPDFIKSIVNKKKLLIRSPNSIRPWQYILDCLAGYLLIGQNLLEGSTSINNSWNLGPKNSSNITVEELVNKCQKIWKNGNIEISQLNKYKESKYLKLDISKSKKSLGWKPTYNINDSVSDTINWYKSYFQNGDVKTKDQLYKYFKISLNQRARWILN